MRPDFRSRLSDAELRSEPLFLRIAGGLGIVCFGVAALIALSLFATAPQ